MGHTYVNDEGFMKRKARGTRQILSFNSSVDQTVKGKGKFGPAEEE